MTTSIQQDALLSQLASLAYKDQSFLNNPANIPAGWTFVKLEVEGPFAAAIFRNTEGQIAIAFRGTNGVGDIPADGSILTGGWNSEFQKGMDLVQKVIKTESQDNKNFNNSQLLVTGHSLGGAIAQIVAYAYGLDGSTIDPGAAKRIVESDGFKAATLAAGLPEGGVGIPATFTNHLVVGSVVSGSTGEHLGDVSYIPSLNFSSIDALKSFLLAVVNPVAGFVYAVGVDQFGNKHSSQQISEALGLLAGMSTDAEGAGRITLSPKLLGVDSETGAPRYSQTEFEIKNADGEVQGGVKFSGQGLDRTMEMFDADGQLKTTVRQSSNGGVVTITGNGQNIEIQIAREQRVENDNGTVTIIRRDSSGQIISTTNTQTFDDGSQLELKTEGGKTYVRSLVPNEEGGVDRSEWSELKASQPELSPQAYQQLIYSDMAGFLSALRNGDKLNQALYGVKLTLDVMLSQGKTLDQSMAGLRDGLDAVAGAVGVVAALHALQSDDTLTQLNGAVGLLSSSNQLFAAINGGAIGEGLTTNGFLDKGDLAALQVVSSLIALSNLKNLDNMLDNGQVGSAGATVYQAVKAVQFLAAAAETGSLTQAAAGTAPDLITAVIIVVVAWALDEIFAEDAPPPPPKPPAGWAEFKLVNDSLSWVFHDKMADGQALGYADTVMGKTILNEKMSKLLSTLKTQLEQANRGSTDTDRELCVVASRIPKVYLQSWLVGADETNGKDIDKAFSYSQSCAFTRRRTHKQNRHHTTQGAQHASLEQ